MATLLQLFPLSMSFHSEMSFLEPTPTEVEVLLPASFSSVAEVFGSVAEVFASVDADCKAADDVADEAADDVADEAAGVLTGSELLADGGRIPDALRGG